MYVAVRPCEVSTILLPSGLHKECYNECGRYFPSKREWFDVLQREGATPSSSDNDEGAPMVIEEGSRAGKQHGRCPDRDRNYCERS